MCAVRVATWNVNSLNARMPRFIEWLDETSPDVVCIQETKMKDGAFPTLELKSLGYDSVHFGQGQWNGVAIISRVGIENPVSGIYRSAADEEARAVTAICGGVGVVSVYVPNGRSLDNDHYLYKLAWLEQLKTYIAASFAPTDDLVVAGDFNIAPQDRDVWSMEAMAGCTHVSELERDAFQALLDWGLHDSFRRFYHQEGLYSWWDHRGGAFHKRQGLRIDFLLVSDSINRRLDWALIDRNARKGEKPSDHAPVVIQFASP